MKKSKTRRWEVVAFEKNRLLCVMVDKDKGRVLRAARAARAEGMRTAIYPVRDFQNGIYPYGSYCLVPVGRR